MRPRRGSVTLATALPSAVPAFVLSCAGAAPPASCAPASRAAGRAARARRIPPPSSRPRAGTGRQGAGGCNVRPVRDRSRLGRGPNRLRPRRSGLPPPARGWRGRVEPPRGAGPGPVLEMVDAAVAPSGDYRRFWMDGQGRRRSHILDPRTGEPVTHGLASVTVVHPQGTTAAP